MREIGINPNIYLTVCLFDPTRIIIAKEINLKLPPYISHLPTCHHCSLALGERQTVNQHGSPLSPTGLFPLEETSLHRRSTSNSKDGNWESSACMIPTTTPQAVTQTSGVCETGPFSYDKLRQTPPLEGTSLHRRYLSVERPWGILSLFTTATRQRL